MPGPWYVSNYRLDTRGHAVAIQLNRFISGGLDPVDEWYWYDLDGNVLSGGSEPVFPHNNLGLRLDTRGHVVAVLAWYDQSQLIMHWYDLDGNDLGVGSVEEGCDLRHVRLDARGHFVAVAMTYEHIWYGLDGLPLAA